MNSKPPSKELVLWRLANTRINELQVASINHLIDRCKHAHYVDVRLRINGQDEWHQADWLKHLTPESIAPKYVNQSRCRKCADTVDTVIFEAAPASAHEPPVEQWISVNDRLPADGDRVIYAFNGYSWAGKYLGCHNDASLPCFASEHGFLTGDVSHWMPMPTAPYSGATKGDTHEA